MLKTILVHLAKKILRPAKINRKIITASLACQERPIRRRPHSPIRVFYAVPEPSFSAAKNSLPGLDLTDVRREAQTTSPAGFFRAGYPRMRAREG